MGYDVSQALGNHEAEVVDVTTEEKGADFIIHVRVRFKDGEIGLKDLYPLKSEKSLQNTRKTLRAMNFDMDHKDLAEVQMNPRLLTGAKVQVVIEENEYNGNITNRIAWINAIPKPASQNLLADVTKKLRLVKKDNRNEEL